MQLDKEIGMMDYLTVQMTVIHVSYFSIVYSFPFFKKDLVLQLKCELLFIEIFYNFQLTHKRRTLPCY